MADTRKRFHLIRKLRSGLFVVYLCSERKLEVQLKGFRTLPEARSWLAWRAGLAKGPGEAAAIPEPADLGYPFLIVDNDAPALAKLEQSTSWL